MAAIAGTSVNVDAQVIDPSCPVDSGKLHKTIITPVIDTKIEAGKSLMFCSTFQMAWNKLCKDIACEPLKLKRSSIFLF